MSERLSALQRDDIVEIRLRTGTKAFPASVNVPPTASGRIDVHHLLEGRDMEFTIGPETEIALAVLADGTVVT